MSDNLTRNSKHLHPKLRRSLRIYVVVAAVMLLFVIHSALSSHASTLFVSLGFIAGIAIGTVFSRIYKISWDSDAKKAIYKIDIFGIILLVIYIAFDLSREHIVELFIHGNSVGATSLALLAGAFYGRVFGMGRDIFNVLKKEKVLS